MADPKAPTWRPWRGARASGEFVWFGDVAVKVTERPDGASYQAEWGASGRARTNIPAVKRVAIDAVRAMLREATEALEAYERESEER